MCLLLCITNVLAAFIGESESETVTAPFWQWASTARWRCLDLETTYLGSDLLTMIHNQRIGSLYGQKSKRHGHCPILEISFKRESTEGQWSINDCWCCIVYNRRAVPSHLPMMKVMSAFMDNVVSVDVATTWKWVSTERQQSFNDCRCCILYNPGAVLWHLLIIEVLAACVGNMDSVHVATPENKSQQSINRASTILGPASWILQVLWYGIYL